MKELEIIELIKKTLNSKYINDDCAYLEDLQIVVAQDSLVEGIHFLREFTTPFMLGYKAVAVNLSDVYASGAKAKYLTCSLSLPKYVDTDFIEEFYKGAQSVDKSIEIVGGDITGSEKIFISICAIGSAKGRKISSRANAKAGYKIITSGVHGSSGCGLELLKKGLKEPENLIQAHLMPKVDDKLSSKISTTIQKNYAMMDSSDGLMDVLYKISKQSGLCAVVDFDKIPIDEEIKNFDFENKVFYGAEDYKIIACVDGEFLKTIDNSLYTEIGFMQEKIDENYVKVNFKNEFKGFSEKEIEKKTFNHFQ